MGEKKFKLGTMMLDLGGSRS